MLIVTDRCLRLSLCVRQWGGLQLRFQIFVAVCELKILVSDSTTCNSPYI
jgi:hypothetical protein